MNENPLISVIVPIYKVEAYLNECVQSILAQTYKNLEIILVDDGSPDRCPQLCDEYAAAHPNIRVVHKQNGGLSSARNAGLDVASGEYVMFVDSDDSIEPPMISHHLQMMIEHNADVVTCQRKSLDGKQSVRLYHRCLGEVNTHNLLIALLYDYVDMSACLKLYKRSIIGDTRFVKGITNEDFVFLLEVYPRCKCVYNLKEQYYNYRLNPSSITNVFNAHYFDRLDNIKYLYNSPQFKAPEFDEAKKVCLSHRHIDTAIEIRRFSCTKKFADRLKVSHNYVRNNLLYILASRKMGWKYKVKTFFVLAHLKFFLK